MWLAFDFAVRWGIESHFSSQSPQRRRGKRSGVGRERALDGSWSSTV